MRIAVRRFQDADAEAVDRLNRRLEKAGCEHRVYKEDLSRNPDADLNVRPINDALFVAVDGNEIRGASWLREQYFWAYDTRHRIGWMKYPVAESLVDPRYAGVPGSMILQLLRHQPILMALGMGGHSAPFARLLAGIGWKSSSIPFLFRVSRPFHVCRQLLYARRRALLRAVMDLAAWSGAAWVANHLHHAACRRAMSAREVNVTVEHSFTPWADRIWEGCRSAYHALAVRDARTLDHLYPRSFPCLDRLRVARRGSDIGWACAQMLPENQNIATYFGTLRVGIITDALALPDDASVVLATAVRHLEQIGADLVVTYLSHAAWLGAARRLAFLTGPSNLAFYQSPRAEKLLLDDGTLATRCHLTRSDCDGPYNLYDT